MNTGVEERFQGANLIDAGKLSPYWGEHAARYMFARRFIRGKRVLDIACGTGYGIALLKQEAEYVAGVDVDSEAAGQALVECDERAAVLVGDGLRLPFADETFDVVTSFETLEHLHKRTVFLSELRRVLKPAGLLLLSTPNANYTQPVDGKPSNPFHIHEYTPDELRLELNQQFIVKNFFGQELKADFGIPPFYDAQQRLSTDFRTQARLVGWKLLNKMPMGMRESVSKTLWGRPFYPDWDHYIFSETNTNHAPVLVAVCGKRHE